MCRSNPTRTGAPDKYEKIALIRAKSSQSMTASMPVARRRLSAARLSRANEASEPSSIATMFSGGTTPSISTTSRFLPSSRMCRATPG